MGVQTVTRLHLRSGHKGVACARTNRGKKKKYTTLLVFQPDAKLLTREDLAPQPFTTVVCVLVNVQIVAGKLV